MKVGTAKYTGMKKRFKIVDGANVYRILPPMGDLAEKGRWSQYYSVEWGYVDLGNKIHPFQSPRVVNRQTKMIEVESAAHLRRQALLEKKDLVIKAFAQGRATKEDVVAIKDLLQRFNLENKHYLNVMNLNGEIGLLKIGHRAKMALDAEIKNLRAAGIDPLSLDNGRFFNFFRSGMGNDTQYQVTVYAENVQATIEGRAVIVKQDKIHKMDETFLKRLDDEAFELDKLYPVVTAADVEKMVKEGARAVQEILGKPQEEQGPVEEEVEDTAEVATQLLPPVTAPTPPVASVLPPVQQTQPTTAPVCNVAPVQVITTPVTTPVQVSTPAPVTQTLPPTTLTPLASPLATPTMSDEDWLKSIGM